MVSVICYIAGLDVAQPGFEGYNDTVRLDKNDAEFVDAIHTNGASFFPSRGLGCINPIGKCIYILAYLNQFDQIADLSARSSTLLISSSLWTWAHENEQSKVKGGMLPSLKTNMT